MKSTLSIVIVFSAFLTTAFAQPGTGPGNNGIAEEYKKAKETYFLAQTATIEQVIAKEIWTCRGTSIESNGYDLDNAEFRFIKKGSKIIDLNKQENGFKNYKLIKGELISSKRMTIGLKITNSIRFHEDRLVMEIKTTGLIGRIMDHVLTTPLAYIICE